MRFWRCANERAQAQAVAGEVERLVRSGVAPGDVGIVVRSVSREGQALAVALEERAVPYRLVGARAFFQRAEVKDVLAWLRLLVDPSDAGAVVRALSRAPVELRAIDLARCVQIARRRKLDMVTALVAATESPQLPPEARERVLGFLRLHRSVAAALDTSRPDLFVHRLVDRLGLRRQGLFAAQADVVERLQALARLGDLAASYVRRVAAGDRARLRPPRRRGGRGRAAGRRGRRRGRRRRGRGRGAAHARRPRDGLPPRPRLRPALRADAGRAAARLRADPRRAAARAAAARHARGARRRDAPAAAPGDDARRRGARPGLRRARGHAAPCSPRRPSPRRRGRRSAPSGTSARRSSSAPTRRCTRPSSRCATTSCGSLPRVGSRLGELRLDTDLDVAHGVVRYLELSSSRRS